MEILKNSCLSIFTKTYIITPIRISEIFSERSVRKSQNKQLNRTEKDVVWFGEIQYNTDKGSCQSSNIRRQSC